MLLSVLLILVISLLAIIYLWFKINFNYWTRYPQVPSVKGRIFSGNLLDFITFKTNFGFHIQNIYEDKKFENAAVVGIYGLYRPALLIREPELLRSIFIRDFDLFRNRSCEGGDHDLYGSLNLFFARYPYWKEIRSKLVPIFSTGKLKYMFPMIQQVGDNLEAFLNTHQERFELEVTDVSNRYVIDVLSCTILGIVCNSLENSESVILKEVLKLVEFRAKRAFQILIIFFAPKLNPLVRPRVFDVSTEKFMKETITQMMKERERTGIMRHDLIDAFLKIKQEAAEKGDDISHCLDGIIAQACILIFAAFDATIRSISLGLLELAKNETVQRRLREEIIQDLLKENGEISYDCVNKMAYLEMVLSETLRMYPALPVTERMHEFHPQRTAGFNLKPFYDYQLPNKMPIYVSVFGIHYDEKFWPNPFKFDPERFSPANKIKQVPMSYLPFGEGPHMCIASRLGLLLAKVAIISVLKNHYIRVCKKTVTEPLYEMKSCVLQLKHGLYIEFVRDNLFSEKINLLKKDI